MLKQLMILLTTFLSYLNAQSCTRLTTRELKTKLKTFGGYNKRYLAITKKDAGKFPRLLNKTSAVKMGGAYNIMKRLFRSKRQATFYPQTNFTTVAKRGSLDQNGLLHLCTEWPAVTTLSADYFPRYLSEVVCDTVDSSCFSYQGQCVQGSFVVNVLKKTGACGADGKEKWDVASQSVRTSCICRLFQGSFLSGYL